MMESNCRNCGASLSVAVYRDRLACEYCSTVHVPSFREIGWIQELDGASSGLDCPICGRQLAHARLDKARLKSCSACHGLLVNGDDLLDMILYCRRDATEPHRHPEPLAPADLDREIACPRCRRRMSVHPYYGPGDFVIDSCADCGLVWLDPGELGRASDVAWGGSLWR